MAGAALLLAHRSRIDAVVWALTTTAVLRELGLP